MGERLGKWRVGGLAAVGASLLLWGGTVRTSGGALAVAAAAHATDLYASAPLALAVGATTDEARVAAPNAAELGHGDRAPDGRADEPHHAAEETKPETTTPEMRPPRAQHTLRRAPRISPDAPTALVGPRRRAAAREMDFGF